MATISDGLVEGALVRTHGGKWGIVIAHDWRRDHQYLDRDLWLLLLIGKQQHWVRGDEVDADVEIWEDDTKHL
jgi:hypothetical protein